MLNYLVVYRNADDETIPAYFQTLFSAKVYETALKYNNCENVQFAQLTQEWE